MARQPKYPLEDGDRALVEEVLGLAQRLVDLQYDDETHDELQLVLTDVADLFGIECQEIHVSVDEDGVVTAKAQPTQPLIDTRRGLTLVSDNSDKIVPLKADLPEGFSLEPDKPRSGPPEAEE